MLRKILVCLVPIITILSSYYLYQSEYNLSINENDIEIAVSEFLNEKIELRQYKEVDNLAFVVYTIEKDARQGFTVLYRGMNQKYQLRFATYFSPNTAFRIDRYKSLKNEYVVLYGKNIDEAINYVELNASNSSELVLVEPNEYFIETIKYNNINYDYFEARILDIDMDDITPEYKMKIKDKRAFGGSKHKAEIFLLYVYITGFLIIGFIVTFSLVKRKDTSSNTTSEQRSTGE